MLLQLNNARLHTILTTSTVTLNIRLDVVLLLPYSQNLALSAI